MEGKSFIFPACLLRGLFWRVTRKEKPICSFLEEKVSAAAVWHGFAPRPLWPPASLIHLTPLRDFLFFFPNPSPQLRPPGLP